MATSHIMSVPTGGRSGSRQQRSLTLRSADRVSVCIRLLSYPPIKHRRCSVQCNIRLAGASNVQQPCACQPSTNSPRARLFGRIAHTHTRAPSRAPCVDTAAALERCGRGGRSSPHPRQRKRAGGRADSSQDCGDGRKESQMEEASCARTPVWADLGRASTSRERSNKRVHPPTTPPAPSDRRHTHRHTPVVTAPLVAESPSPVERAQPKVEASRPEILRKSVSRSFAITCAPAESLKASTRLVSPTCVQQCRYLGEHRRRTVVCICTLALTLTSWLLCVAASR